MGSTCASDVILWLLLLGRPLKQLLGDGLWGHQCRLPRPLLPAAMALILLPRDAGPQQRTAAPLLHAPPSAPWGGSLSPSLQLTEMDRQTQGILGHSVSIFQVLLFLQCK